MRYYVKKTNRENEVSLCLKQEQISVRTVRKIIFIHRENYDFSDFYFKHKLKFT